MTAPPERDPGPPGPGPADSGPAAAEAAPGGHRAPPAGTTANLVVALAVTAVGIAGAAGSWSLGLGSAAAPSAGTWPFLISTAITCLGIALATQARRTGDAEALTPATWRIATGTATMAGFAALVGVIGFEIPSFLLALVWLRFLGGESWRLSLSAALGIVAAFYAVFVGALAVPIPHLF